MGVLLQQSLQPYRVIAAVIMVALGACSSPQVKQKIAGGIDAEILNLSDSTIIIRSDVSPLEKLRGAEPAIYQKIRVDSNGIFMNPFDYPEGYYWIQADRNAMRYFIQQGKKLSLDFDATKPFEKPEFSGKLKYESRYLFDRYLLISSFKASENLYLSQSEEVFVDVISDLRSKLDTALVMYITNHPTGAETFMRQEALRNYYLSAFYFEKYYGIQKRTHKLDSLSPSFMELRNKVGMNDRLALSNDMYFRYVSELIQNTFGPVTELGQVKNHLHWIDSVFTIEEVADFAIYELAKSVAKNKFPEQKPALDTLVNEVSDELIQRHLIEEIISDTSNGGWNQQKDNS